MALSYGIYINKEKVSGIEIGFNTVDNWEEALDDMSFTIPISKKSEPYKMLSLIELVIDDGDEIRTRAYLLASDEVVDISKYGYYQHKIYGIEYTDKANKYILNDFASSKRIKRGGKAKILLNTDGETIINIQNGNSRILSKSPFLSGNPSNVSRNGTSTIYVFTKNLDLNTEYSQGERIVIPKIDQAWQATDWSINVSMNNEPMVRSDMFITSSLFEGRKQISGTLAPNETIIDTSNASGSHWLELQVYAHGWTHESEGLPDRYEWVYRYEFDIIPKAQISVYDVLMSVRALISKFGGIERRDLFDITRMFDIDSEKAQYLKSVEAPEIYLQKATALQVINFILSYVNGIGRLEYTNEQENDSLTVDYFNKSQGSFDKEGSIAIGSSQNTNQIGTQAQTYFEGALPTEFNEPNITLPQNNWYKNVRATDLQFNDTNFELKLDESRKLYAPVKLEVLVPNMSIRWGSSSRPKVEFSNVWIDLTNVWIHIDEWKLKEISNDFPEALVQTAFEQSIMTRDYKIVNLYWQKGDTSIKMSDSYGIAFKSNHIKSVINRACLEYLMLNLGEPVIYNTGDPDVYNVNLNDFKTNLGSGQYWFKDLKFRVEYVTDNNLNVKHDKEDLTEIDFFSEMKVAQEENTVNLSRASRKVYGDLQRSGNKEIVFQRLHKKLSEQYAMGTTDINNYTVVSVQTEWQNDYFLSKYTLNKHFNRISIPTYIDQAYRPFYQYNKDIMVRHDNYRDYLIATRPNEVLEDLVSSLIHRQGIYEILETLKGRNYATNVNSESNAVLIRTDGTIDLYKDVDFGVDNNKFYQFISVPLSSSGLKQGFSFDFGFKNNLVANDKLENIVDENTNAWYNRAVRYADNYGNIKHLDFYMGRGTDFTDLNMENYPHITLNSQLVDELVITQHFGMNEVLFNDSSQQALVVNKDTRTNYNISFQVTVINQKYNEYVFGQSFFSQNFIVNNVITKNNEKMYFYGYNDYVEYKLFDDLRLKEGYNYVSEINNNNISIVDVGNGGLGIRFSGNIDYTRYANWAIADGDKNLYVASNVKENGFNLVPSHIRPNIMEIGLKKLPFKSITLRTTSNFETNVIKGLTVTTILDEMLDNNFGLTFIKNKAIGETLNQRLRTNFAISYFVGNSYNTSLGLGDLVSDMGLLAVRGRTLEQNLNLPLTANMGVLASKGQTLNEEIDFDLKSDMQVEARKGLSLQQPFIMDTLQSNVQMQIEKGKIIIVETYTLSNIIDLAMDVAQGRVENETLDFENLVTDFVVNHFRTTNVGGDINLSNISRFVANFIKGKQLTQTLNLGLRNNFAVTFRVGENDFIDFNEALTSNFEVEFTRTKDIGSSFNEFLESDFVVEFIKQPSIPLNITVLSNLSVGMVKGKVLTQNLNSTLINSLYVDIRRSKDLFYNTNFNLRNNFNVNTLKSTDLFRDLNQTLRSSMVVAIGQRLDLSRTLHLIVRSNMNVEVKKDDLENVASPIINGRCVSDGSNKSIQYWARNNDTKAVELYMSPVKQQVEQKQPSAYIGTLQPNQTSPTFNYAVSGNNSVTIYALASISENENSPIAERTILSLFCQIEL